MLASLLARFPVQSDPDECHFHLLTFSYARGAPPPLALARRLRASLGPQALPLCPLCFQRRADAATPARLTRLLLSTAVREGTRRRGLRASLFFCLSREGLSVE